MTVDVIRAGGDGYETTAQLSRYRHSALYQGRRNSDSEPVLIEFVTTDERRTASHRGDQALDRLIKNGLLEEHRLTSETGECRLVYRSPGEETYLLPAGRARSRRTVTNDRRLSIQEFFALADGIAHAVEQIHACGVVHSALCPECIVGNRQADAFVIAGCAAAVVCEEAFVSAFAHYHQSVWQERYTAPETRTRPDRIVDYRCDLYSLGVIYFELITGTPYDAATAFARPSDKALAGGLMELLRALCSEHPEDRVQSIAGLRSNLATLESARPASSGKAARAADTIHTPRLFAESGHLYLSKKLYGRTQELEHLCELYGRTGSQGNETNVPSLVLVSGAAGTGKTALVAAAGKHVASQGGLFASGKFDPSQQASPYSALLELLANLSHAAQRLPEHAIRGIRHRLAVQSPEDTGLLLSLVPQMRHLFGHAAKAASDNSTIATYSLPLDRLARATITVMRDFATATHPLFLVVDDIQWADLASLRLLKFILPVEIPHVLLVATIRPEENWTPYPVRATIREIESIGSQVEIITLRPLSHRDMVDLLHDTLGRSEEREELASAIHTQTDGNPLFTGELLGYLKDRQFFVRHSSGEGWGHQEIAQVWPTLPGSVVALTTKRIDALPPETQKLLADAAYLGSRFDRQTLALLSARDRETVEGVLFASHRDGFVLPDTVPSGGFRFAHDLLRSAFAALIPEQER